MRLFKRVHIVRELLFVAALVVMCAAHYDDVPAHETRPRHEPLSPSVAVLDFGGDDSAPAVTDEMSRAVAADDKAWRFVNPDLARAAARGAGYAGSLNMTLDEARDLGRSIGCDFYFTGRAEVVRRSPATGKILYEAYAAVFLVGAGDGRLVMFDYAHAEAAAPDAARSALRRTLLENFAGYRESLLRAHEDERRSRSRARDDARVEAAALIADAPAEDEAGDLRLPQPYRRLRPRYTDTAARAGAEATVDVAAEIDTRGEVVKIEVWRWAGFNLDEAVTSTVRAMYFRPAMNTKTGEAVPLRVLLRYNFRRPATAKN